MDCSLAKSGDPLEQLHEIKDQYGIDLHKIVGQLEMLAQHLLKSVQSPPISNPSDIVLELSDLLTSLRETKSEILSFNSQEVKADFIPQATEELDAIVDATATATNTIMDSAEKIEEAANNVTLQLEAGTDASAVVAELQANQADAVMQIFEACSFQDITGQRITKVIKVIQEIEESVDRLTGTFGMGGTVSALPADLGAGDETDIDGEPEVGNLGKELANGPQLPDEAISQDDIDALLASFD